MVPPEPGSPDLGSAGRTNRCLPKALASLTRFASTTQCAGATPRSNRGAISCRCRPTPQRILPARSRRSGDTTSVSACPTMRRPRPGTREARLRVLQEWPYGVLQLAYLSPAADDDFHLELLAGPVRTPASPRRPRRQSRVRWLPALLRARRQCRRGPRRVTAAGCDVVGEPFEIEDISRRLALFRDPWGNMIELSETLPGAGADLSGSWTGGCIGLLHRWLTFRCARWRIPKRGCRRSPYRTKA